MELPQFPVKKNTLPKVWLVIFSDMLALLLAFFVLLFSMSTVDSGAWQAMVGSLAQRLNPIGLTKEQKVEEPPDIPRLLLPRAANLDYLHSVLEQKTETEPVLANAVMQRLDDRLVISLPADFLFPVGGATLTDVGLSSARVLGDMLHLVGNQIDVNGHTDPKIMAAGGEFESNWDLSLARAVAVARALQDGGFERPVVAYGLADSRFDDIAATLGRDARMSLARRVDVVVRNRIDAELGEYGSR
jgi:chemotaxis protein MotB